MDTIRCFRMVGLVTGSHGQSNEKAKFKQVVILNRLLRRIIYVLSGQLRLFHLQVSSYHIIWMPLNTKNRYCSRRVDGQLTTTLCPVGEDSLGV